MRRVITIFIIMIIIIASVTGVTYYLFYMPNSKVIPAFDEGKLNLVIGGDVIDTKYAPRLVNDEILLPFDIVSEYFDPNIYWDSKLKKLTVTTVNKVIRMKTDSLSALINNKPVKLNIPVSVSDNTVYIPIQFLSEFYNIKINFIKENNVIVIDYVKKTQFIAQTKDININVRRGMSIHYPIVEKIEKGRSKENNIILFEENSKWYKVRTWDGVVGYIEKRFVTGKLEKKSQKPVIENKSPVWKPVKGKINLVWDDFWHGKSSEPDFSKTKGLDVVSPTWFVIGDEKGNVINNASARYVEWSHQHGIKVWALVRNDSININMTSEFLNNTDSRDNAIRQILAFASLYDLDGINIDFENVKKSDKNTFTQFIRELTPFLKEQGLVVSVDVTVPDGSDNWSKCYDREALGQIADYIMLMAYDEYWSTSPVAGPVAEIGWVESNICKVLSSVPKEKLLLGLPFYSREWVEKPDAQGNLEVESPAKTLTMNSENKLILENNADPKWDAATGQFYAEFEKNGSTVRVWLEDSNSINLKSSLVQKYDLAGTSSWRKDYEDSVVWNVLNDNLKNIDSYGGWLKENKNAIYSYR